ncbi:MAG: GAF domain-containing protein [Cytophagaceae bacterium]|nr:GAF domain-containing protein [Cytophagaceae bacterium]MDW8456815.1 GAF domain-containing protein [Cytophagaceae bacterium]
MLTIPTVLVASLLYYTLLQLSDIKNYPKVQLAKSTSASVIDKIDTNFSDRLSEVKMLSSLPIAISALQDSHHTQQLVEYMNKVCQYKGYYELFMLCDLDGNVIATNTTDKNGNKINAELLLGKNMKDKEWFGSCMATGGPYGGAYFSELTVDEYIKQLYPQSSGLGMDVAAPVKNVDGKTIGVWRSRASWNYITQQIRKESENTLLCDEPGAHILIFDATGRLIDGRDESEILKLKIGKNNLLKSKPFDYMGKKINADNMLYGWAQSKGISKYSGHQWKVLTVIPKVKLTSSTILSESGWIKLFSFSLTFLGMAILFSLLFVKKLSKRIKKLTKQVLKIAKGNPGEITLEPSGDELADINNAVYKVSEAYKTTSRFAEEIGKGNLRATFQTLGKNDMLGQALLQMKENLIELKAQEEKQQWASAGMAQLNELLYQTTEKDKGNHILRFLCNYCSLQQGAMYLVEEKDGSKTLELIGKYSLSRQRIEAKTLSWNEGLLGQAIRDGCTIEVSELPENYSFILSGLGKAKPGALLIIPLKAGNVIVGAMEFISFCKANDSVKHFLEKSAQYIALTLQNMKSRKNSEHLFKCYLELKERLEAKDRHILSIEQELAVMKHTLQHSEKEWSERILTTKQIYEERIQPLEKELSFDD